MLTAITGINWGDEGKGRMVDLISQEYDIVARYQGGNNAGHTVKNERGKFVLNLLRFRHSPPQRRLRYGQRHGHRPAPSGGRDREPAQAGVLRSAPPT